MWNQEASMVGIWWELALRLQTANFFLDPHVTVTELASSLAFSYQVLKPLREGSAIMTYWSSTGPASGIHIQPTAIKVFFFFFFPPILGIEPRASLCSKASTFPLSYIPQHLLKIFFFCFFSPPVFVFGFWFYFVFFSPKQALTKLPSLAPNWDPLASCFWVAVITGMHCCTWL